MDIYAGLDVSDETTHICVVDDEGAIMRRDVVASDPDALARWLNKHCPGLKHAGEQHAISLHWADLVARAGAILL